MEKKIKNFSYQRLQKLDILKALAMLGVIIVHFNNIHPQPISILSKLNAIGAKCPQLFFIISAFLTWNGLEKKSQDWKFFYKKRLIRIIPLFYSAIIIASVIPVFRIQDISIENWLSHVLFLNGINPMWINSIMGIEWYIADLAIFYFITPLLWKITQNLKNSLLVFCFSVVMSSLTLILYNRFIESDNISIKMYFETFLFIHQFPVIMMGIILFHLIKKLDNKKLWKLLIFLGIGIIFITILFIVLHLDKNYLTNSFIAGLYFSWLFLIIWQLNLFENSLLKPLAFIGTHSFGIYCFHQIVINCVSKLITLQFSLNTFSVWCLTFGIIVLISILTGYIMETLQNILLRKIIHIKNNHNFSIHKK